MCTGAEIVLLCVGVVIIGFVTFVSVAILLECLAEITRLFRG